jgi:hypothetical protein
MKRLHVHVSVEDIPQSVRFYSTLFAADPAVLKDNYAKWMLDDPHVNFAISTRAAEKGLDHLGIHAETESELHEVYNLAERRPAGARGRCYDLLLRRIGKGVDRGPARHIVGNLPDDGREHGLRR